LWIGITRRRSAQLLLVAIAINGVALAVVAILQRLTESDRLLFFWPRPTVYFVASFISKNHAGAYLNLILALCLGLAWWHADRAEQRMAKSHPGLLFLFLAVFVAVALLFTYAVAATALGVAFVLAVAIGYITQRIFHAKHSGSSRGATLLTAGLCAVFLGLCAYSLNIEKVSRKFRRVSDEEYTSSITYSSRPKPPSTWAATSSGSVTASAAIATCFRASNKLTRKSSPAENVASTGSTRTTTTWNSSPKAAFSA
ncbi:MAG TPA: hypothetical protein VEA63_12725, partial [Opitutus sp.]|nr:hypothetical protein [Opitutus sp.]